VETKAETRDRLEDVGKKARGEKNHTGCFLTKAVETAWKASSEARISESKGCASIPRSVCSSVTIWKKRKKEKIQKEKKNGSTHRRIQTQRGHS